MTRLKPQIIRLDGGTQPRAALCKERIAEYAENLQAGAVFPPVEVCYDGRDYWLWDGFHRVHACLAAGMEEVEANIIPGTQADAQWLSYSANKTHGLFRSNEDKQRAVRAAMEHPKSAQLSNRQLAEHCGVSEITIRRHRGQDQSTATMSQSTPRTGRDGRTINTANIGKPRGTVVRRTAPRGTARDAFMPVRGHSNPPPMVGLSLPRNNPDLAASTLIELFDRSWLAVLVERVAKHLNDQSEPKTPEETADDQHQ